MERETPSAIAGLEIRTAGSEVIVHDPAHRKVHVLNGTAGMVLALCDGEHAIDEIAEALARRAGLSSAQVVDDVEAIIATFRSLDVVR
jgi:hypothetical protein